MTDSMTSIDKYKYCTHDTAGIVTLVSGQEIISVTATATITERYAHQLLRNESPSLEVSSAWSRICFLHANHCERN